MKKNYYIIILFWITLYITAQKHQFVIPDSLINKSFKYLDDKIYELKDDSLNASVYLFTYLKKAEVEQNWKEVSNAYKNLMHQSPEKLKLFYADSLLFAAKKTKNNGVIGAAYLSKGILYYSWKQENNALDNYIIANNYISKTDDKYQIHKVKYHIALIKFYLGFYDEAISLLRQCVLYYKVENPRPYLNSLHSLGISYNKIGNYGLCSQINDLGISESNNLAIPEMTSYFLHSEGINEYFQKNYAKSIHSIESTLDDIQSKNDFANVSIGNFYIGKSYWELNKKEKAILYFEKVDKTFNDKSYLRSDLRQVFELLINYYNSKNDLNKQLYYVNQLLKADTLLTENNKYLISKIHKEYDTKTLLAEKEKISEQLLHKKFFDILFAIIILILFLIIVILTFRHFKNRLLYKKKYDELMIQLHENNTKPKIKNDKTQIGGISADTVVAVLKQLDKFENNKIYLGKDWNLVTLSAAFSTNTKYLASILQHHRNKGFVEYINELRIDYIISLLHNENKYRKYTNEALAIEAGFSTTQRFSNAFLLKTGMPTHFFIEQLKKEKQ